MRLPQSSGIVRKREIKQSPLKLPSKNLIFILGVFRNGQNNCTAEDVSIVLLWEWELIFVAVSYT